MMADVPAGLILDKELLALAYCVSIWRSDGVRLGFTSHDRPIRADGLLFEPRTGFIPSAVVTSNALRPDRMELQGILGASGISPEELADGRWRQARVEVSLCDWSAAAAEIVPVFRGVIAGVRQSAVAGRPTLVLELLSEMVLAGRETLPVCSPLCRAELGDRWCGVDLAGRRTEVDIIGCDGRMVRTAEPVANPAAHALGTLRILTGPAAGLDRRILLVDGDLVHLDEEVGHEGEVAWRARLTEGCDKRLQTCRDRYGNVEAFLGQPHVPGTDALLRFGDG